MISGKIFNNEDYLPHTTVLKAFFESQAASNYIDDMLELQ
jgi:hypothetical protein